MYELVKKKNTAQKVLLTILALFLITSVLKELFSIPRLSIDDELVKAANEINAHAPIVIDSTTRFDNVNALHGRVLEYNYTITNIERALIDTVELARVGRELMIKSLKENPKAAYFRENDVNIIAKYVDEKGLYLARFGVGAKEY